MLGYGAHTWELFGFRTWLVAFMAFAAAGQAACRRRHDQHLGDRDP